MKRAILMTCISGKRPRPIRIEIRPILLLFAYFQVNTVSHFSFLDRLALLIGMMRMLAQPNAFRQTQSSLKRPRRANRMAAAISRWVCI
jgi:hypothetical protein